MPLLIQVGRLGCFESAEAVRDASDANCSAQAVRELHVGQMAA